MNTKSLKVKLLAAFCFVLFSISAIAQRSQNLNIDEYKLDNGLTVILHEDPSASKVFGLVVVRAGGKNDPVDATGMAHYQEHMLFKGTQEIGTINWEEEQVHIEKIFELYDELGKTEDEGKRAGIQKKINEESLKANQYVVPNEFSNLIKEMGGTNMNANTSPDRTVFFNSFPPNQIEKWLEIYSHRFMNPVFRSFQAELEVVYEEKNLYQDKFQFQLLEKFQENFFKNHPYGQQTLIGSSDDLKNPSLSKMYEFFKTYYVANNMALILSGNFNSKEIKPVIQQKFGEWESGDIPKRDVPQENPFKGREYVKAANAPIPLFLLGFRSVTPGHPDELPLQICNRLLNNENQTGLLDKLSLNNELLAAMSLPLPYYDHGANIILVVPKLFHSRKKAEKLVLNQIQKLKKGEFEDWQFKAIKREMLKNYALELENIENKALLLGELFAQGRNVRSIMKYPELLSRISRKQVIDAANKYFGDNYLAFYTKLGVAKKDKVTKPDYDPITPNENLQSSYAENFKQMPVKLFEPEIINFEEDIQTFELRDGIKYYYTDNPKNKVFTLTMRYNVGNHSLPKLQYAADLLNMAGTSKMPVDSFKTEFNKLACSYYVYSDDSYLYVNLDGFEENLSKALFLINELLHNPVIEEDKISYLANGIKTERRMERSEPDNVASALFEYVRYGDNSRYKNRLTLKEIKDLKPEDLHKEISEAVKYSCSIHYVGKLGAETVGDKILQTMHFENDPFPGNSPIIRRTNIYSENTVYLVNKKKAVQNKIFFYVNGIPYDTKNKAVIDAFNMYFGGGFSGLVLQEIREFRSLAYSAGAYFSQPALKAYPADFVGYVGTQADKTIEAVEVFNGLIRNMPEKNDRMDMIKNYLKMSATTKRPSFRELSKSIEKWKLLEYNIDPVAEIIDQYGQLNFEDIKNWYTQNLKNQNLVIMMVGNEKMLDLDKLKGYGKIVELEEDELFTK